MKGRSARQAYALAHPLNEPIGSTEAYKLTRAHASGLLLLTILAIDR